MFYLTMDYKIDTVDIRTILEWVNHEKIILNPEYQRNFIWGPKDQKELIDSVEHGYPLPTIFVYNAPDGKKEIVDGQQRIRTLIRFYNGEITSSIATGKKKIDDFGREKFLNYKLPIVYIENLKAGENLSAFYVLINKKGKHLNIPEIQKSEYLDSPFLKFAEDCLSYPNFIDLDLFSKSNSDRMNDREFVQELIGQIIYGIIDKKTEIERLFLLKEGTVDFPGIGVRFKKVIDLLYKLNKVENIKNTRYKQKNDFYSIFYFFLNHVEDEEIVNEFRYRSLLLLNGVDKENRQFIRPSNLDSKWLSTYANNCVTQSNSKNAREIRSYFLEMVLNNKDPDGNDVINDIFNYLVDNSPVRISKDFKEVGGNYLVFYEEVL